MDRAKHSAAEERRPRIVVVKRDGKYKKYARKTINPFRAKLARRSIVPPVQLQHRL